MKKNFQVLLTAFFLGCSSLNPVFANDILEIVIPTPPGGAVDMIARLVSKKLLDNNIKNVIQHQPGANGDIALNRVLKDPDNRIFIGGSANFIFSNLTPRRANIYAQELVIIGPSVNNAMAFYSPINGKFKNFKELVDFAKVNDLPCGVSGIHGEFELKRINKTYKTKFIPVLHKGSINLIPTVAGRHILCAYDQIAPYIHFREKIKFLATSDIKPYDKNIPLISSMFVNYNFTNWFAIGVPKTSDLLKNDKLVNLLKTWTNDKDLIRTAIEASFVVTEYDPTFNNKVIKETDRYYEILD